MRSRTPIGLAIALAMAIALLPCSAAGQSAGSADRTGADAGDEAGSATGAEAGDEAGSATGGGSGASEDYGDLLGGFEEDFDDSALDVLDDEMPDWLEALPYGQLLWERVDLGGSISAGAVYAYHDHKVPNPAEPGTSTSWGNLTRLDLDALLRLDVDLPGDWTVRAEALGWYDFVYRLKGRSGYDGQVLDVYEWQVDSGEVYAAGPLHSAVDLTLGRKIVNWGRSDTFRVVDVVNPLDNKEPGLVDIEDLRRPVTMVKLDLQEGPWSASALALLEDRFDRDPPPGSDFFPDLSAVPAAFRPAITNIPNDGDDDFTGTPGLAAKADARFSGWDASVYVAWKDENKRVIDIELGPSLTPRITEEANRFLLVGAGGNYTRGAWLFKAESAWLHDIRVLRTRASPLAPAAPPIPSSDERDRIDTMVGVEYYGPRTLTVALEIVNRHLLDHPTGGGSAVQLVEQSTFETGLRITRSFFRERMEVTALGIAFGERFQDGGLVRLSADWELTDAWKIDGGALFFIGGPDKGIGAFDSNDRLYLELSYDF